MQICFCFGQSCDDAAAMASERSGVTSIVQNESPLACYFHCATHFLNSSASAAVEKFQQYKMLKTLHEKWLKCLRPVRRKQRCRSPASKKMSLVKEKQNIILSAYMKPDL